MYSKMDKNLDEIKKFGELTSLKEFSLVFKGLYEKATRCRGEGSVIISLKPEKTRLQWKIPVVCIQYVKAVAGVKKEPPGVYLERLIVEDMSCNIEIFKETEKKLRSKLPSQ